MVLSSSGKRLIGLAVVTWGGCCLLSVPLVMTGHRQTQARIHGTFSRRASCPAIPQLHPMGPDAYGLVSATRGEHTFVGAAISVLDHEIEIEVTDAAIAASDVEDALARVVRECGIESLVLDSCQRRAALFSEAMASSYCLGAPERE